MAVTLEITETFLALRERLSRMVRGIVPPKEVEDIVQETYVHICQIDNIEHIREPRSFMFRTAQNLALDHVKRAEHRLTQSEEDVGDIESIEGLGVENHPYAQAASDEEFALFCEAVRHLPQQCRRAFILKKVYGYSLKEIASAMKVSASTVETHIVQGTKKCVLYLRAHEKHTHRRSTLTGSHRSAAKGAHHE